MSSLRDQVALVTRSSRGIGAAIGENVAMQEVQLNHRAERCTFVALDPSVPNEKIRNIGGSWNKAFVSVLVYRSQHSGRPLASSA
ncbi:MAG: hypothetical protein DMG60_00825 [Acidobacteria bacterium]|nr:MAG: hypothetical protein DMG60_00825 [Acidobacteriota bacterium]